MYKRLYLLLALILYEIGVAVAGLELMPEADMIRQSSFLWIPFFSFPFVFLGILIILADDKTWRAVSV